MTVPDPTSRYEGLPEIDASDGNGATRRLLAPRVVPAPPLGGAYEVPPGARLDLLGRDAAGDTTRWWLIADANPWLDPKRIERPGQIIDLPRNG